MPRDFNSYGSRRGNDAIMSRGTFANIRLVNKLHEGGKSGPKTLHIPTNEIVDVFDAAERYIEVCISIRNFLTARIDFVLPFLKISGIL